MVDAARLRTLPETNVQALDIVDADTAAMLLESWRFLERTHWESPELPRRCPGGPERRWSAPLSRRVQAAGGVRVH
jgi:hypothetical protein